CKSGSPEAHFNGSIDWRVVPHLNRHPRSARVSENNARQQEYDSQAEMELQNLLAREIACREQEDQADYQYQDLDQAHADENPSQLPSPQSGLAGVAEGNRQLPNVSKVPGQCVRRGSTAIGANRREPQAAELDADRAIVAARDGHEREIVER